MPGVFPGATSAPACPMSAPFRVVIDSQSLFDWLVFANPWCADWAEVLSGPQWKWVTTDSMRREFDAVARHGFGPRWPVDAAALDAAWGRHATVLPPHDPLGADRRLVCRDRDDQKFIDLAIACGAQVLVSRDNALLKLARKAAERHGVRVLTPLAWNAWRATLAAPTLPPV